MCVRRGEHGRGNWLADRHELQRWRNLLRMQSGDKEEAGGGGEAGLTWTLYDVPLSRPRETLEAGGLCQRIREVHSQTGKAQARDTHVRLVSVKM